MWLGQMPSIIHVVKPGESLSQIAGIYYDDIQAWPTIALANNIKNPDLIQPGQRLAIPPGAKVAQEIMELSTMEIRGPTKVAMTTQQKTGWTIAAIAALLFLGG